MRYDLYKHGRILAPRASIGNAPRTQISFLQIFLGSWCMAYWRRINRGANRLGLHKEQKILCSASLIVIELAYSLSCTRRKWKKIQYKMAAQ